MVKLFEKSKSGKGFDTLYTEAVVSAIESEKGELNALFFQNYNFSLLNLLIAKSQLHNMNLPMCQLATRKNWEKQGKKVRDGMRAIWMRKPFTIDAKDKDGNVIKDANGKNETITLFSFKPWWYAASQLDDYKPIDLNDYGQSIYNFKKAFNDLKLNIVEFDTEHVSAGGYAKVGDKKIAVNPLWKDNSLEVCSTLWHEMMHCVLEHNKATYSTQEKEVEVEVGVYLIHKILNTGYTAQSVGYIKNWAGKELRKILDDKMSKRILNATNKVLHAGMIDKKGEEE